jgi:ribosomal protein S18 acetylase RimI-like enzyme
MINEFSKRTLNFEVLTKEQMLECIDEIVDLSFQSFGNNSWSAEQYLTDLPFKWNLSSFVHDGQDLVGYVIFSSYLKKEEVIGHAHNIAINMKYRGMGLSQKLMTYSKDLCVKNRIGAITIEITKSLSAQHIIGVIEKLGYSRILNEDDLLDYLTTRNKAHLMQQYLDGSNSVYLNQIMLQEK